MELAHWTQRREAGRELDVDTDPGCDREAVGNNPGMAKAVWNGAVIAESDQIIEVEGNQYFPPDAVDRQYLVETQTHTT